MDVIVSGAAGATDRKLKEGLKTKCAASWNASLRCWLVPNSERAKVLSLIDGFSGVMRADARPANKSKTGHFCVIFSKTDVIPSSSSSSSSSSSRTPSSSSSLSSRPPTLSAPSVSLGSAPSLSTPLASSSGGGRGFGEVSEEEEVEEQEEKEEKEEEEKGDPWRFVAAGLERMEESKIRRLVDFHEPVYNYVRNYVKGYGRNTDISDVVRALEDEDAMPDDVRDFLMAWFPGGPAAVEAARRAREAAQEEREAAEQKALEAAAKMRRAVYAREAAERKRAEEEAAKVAAERKARGEARELTAREAKARAEEEAEERERLEQEARLRALQKRRAEEAEEERQELRNTRRKKNVLERTEEEAVALNEREAKEAIAREAERKRVTAERVAARHAARQENAPILKAYLAGATRVAPTHHAYPRAERLRALKREALIAKGEAEIKRRQLPETRAARALARVTARIAENRLLPCANSRLRPDVDDETGDVVLGESSEGKEEKRARVVRPSPSATGDVGKTIRLTVRADDGVDYHVCYDTIKLRMWLRRTYGQYSSRGSWHDPTFNVRFTPEQAQMIERRMYNMDKCDVVVPEPLAWHPSSDGHTVALPERLFTEAVFREKNKAAILNYRLSSPGFAEYAYVTVTEGHGGDSKTIQLPPDIVAKLRLRPDSRVMYESCFALPRIAALALRPLHASWALAATAENKDALIALLEHAIGAKFVTALGDTISIDFRDRTHFLTVTKIQSRIDGPRIDAGRSEGTAVQLEIWQPR